MKTVHAVLLLLLLSAAGCGDDNLPTDPSPGPGVDTTVARTELFQGQISPGATLFYSFAVQGDRNVALTLATLTDAAGRPVDATLTIGFGIPQGTGCGTMRTAPASPSLQSQIVHGTTPGLFCVNLEAGSLSAPANFTVRIRQEPTVASAPTPGTVTFDSQLAPGGASTRTFLASTPGTVMVSLDTLSQPGLTVGLSLGLPRTDGGGCVATRRVEVVSGGGPHISIPADVGFYCVAIFDLGTLAQPAGFTIRIDHP